MAQQISVNMMVLALSFLAQHGSRVCSAKARVGRALSLEQREACGQLERLVAAWYRPPVLTGGRGELKIESLCHFGMHVASGKLGSEHKMPAALQPQMFAAERARFLDQDLHFDPTNFMDIFDATTYTDPSILLLPEARPCPAPKARRVRNEQILAYTREWDHFGKLVLAPAGAVAEPYQLIAAPKDANVDRIVSDRRRQNAREGHIEGASRLMPSGHDIAEFEVPRGHHMLVHSDDLVDMFPSFDAPFERAITNGVAVAAVAQDYKGTAAHRKAKLAEMQKVVPCLVRARDGRHQRGVLRMRQP